MVIKLVLIVISQASVLKTNITQEKKEGEKTKSRTMPEQLTSNSPVMVTWTFY